MGKYRGPVCKLCRREGEKLFLKGARCFTPKCSYDRRSYPPGQHGRTAQFRRRRESDYARQLRAKQKARRIYGVLERQFRRYYDEALNRRGLTGLNLLQILESRLDNVVYRMGYADSRAEARLLVTHGHFDVNGRRTDVPSRVLYPGDEIVVREGSRGRTYFKGLRASAEDRNAPDWVSRDLTGLSGKLVPARHTDFIFSVLAEELGFAGVVGALGLYLLLLWRMLETARLARDRLGAFLAAGITASLAFQVVYNVAMVAGLVPVKGLPLPLLSYGGSSVLATLMGIGLILSVRMRRFAN